MKRISLTRAVGIIAVTTSVLAMHSSPANATSARICGSQAAGMARCHAIVVLDAQAKPQVTVQPFGLTPADLHDAYSLPYGLAGTGQAIGIVAAYRAPTLAADIATYRTRFGLKRCAVSGVAPCLRIVGQTGTAVLPRVNAGWAGEQSLDAEMASAICPNCRIVVVEATSSSISDLAAAEDTAVRLGATVVSNSFGARETAAGMTFASHFRHPGVAVVASSGDDGYAVNFPASLSSVTAVGGTSLSAAPTVGKRRWVERAWAGTGSGCSAFVRKPSWQLDRGCATRTVTDVAAVADPSTGVAIYDSTAIDGRMGWMTLGGTSASAPIIGGVWALAGNARTVAAGANFAAYLYARRGSFNDVTTGANGTCILRYLCAATTGYDGPTGLGSPHGIGGF